MNFTTLNISGTGCCSLQQIECNNNLDKAELVALIEGTTKAIIREKNYKSPSKGDEGFYDTGCYFIIVIRGEEKLERIIKSVGFTLVNKFSRRVSYGRAKNKMYVYNF